MEPITHPDLPFSIEADATPNRFLKRFPNGEVEAATSTEYLLALILTKVHSPTLEAVEGVELEAQEMPFDEILERLDAIEKTLKIKRTTKDG